MIGLIAGLMLTTAPCAPPGGAAALLALDRRIVIVGETHGTVETPAAFGEIVCTTAATWPVLVVLEYPVQMQPTLDAFMAQPDAGTARRLLLDYPHGPFRFHDGRGSEAMMALLQRLREMAQAGADLKLLAGVPDSPRVPGFTQAHAELDRAQQWSAAARAAPQRRMLVLVGSVHAEKTRRVGSALGLPAAAHFRPEETVSLSIARQGGQAWTCREECGVSSIPDVDSAQSSGVALTPTSDGAFDGVLSLGPATPSPPVSR